MQSKRVSCRFTFELRIETTNRDKAYCSIQLFIHFYFPVKWDSAGLPGPQSMSAIKGFYINSNALINPICFDLYFSFAH